MMGQIAQGIAGAITGGLFGGLSIYEQKRAAQKADALATQQYEQAKRTALLEEQERAKQNAKEADVEGLLEENEDDDVLTDLTRGRVRNRLYRRAPALGGESRG